ncbi:MAG: helix-turn-helix transcriptional regulator [Clostridia bacterium]|nr:helix-turn-helix transcriptional regulator [Clostridia bacterium]
MRLKDIREDLDITQQQVAEYLHVKQNTYSQYENGHRQLPIELLMQLALYFHTSTDYILGLTDVRQPYARAGGVMLPTNKRKEPHDAT